MLNLFAVLNVFSHFLQLNGLSLSCVNLSCNFNSKELLTSHEHLHLAELNLTNSNVTVNKFNCDICSETFKTFEDYDFHITTELEVKNWFPSNAYVKCKFCGKKFKSIRTYDNHIRADHEKELPLQCQFCKIPFDVLLNVDIFFSSFIVFLVLTSLNNMTYNRNQTMRPTKKQKY